MSAKMKPQEEKKQDGSKFHTTKYIKVTPVNIASKRRNRNCSFLQLRVLLDCGWGISGETGREGERRKLCWMTYRKNDDNEKHFVNHHLFGFMTAESKKGCEGEGRLLRQIVSHFQRSSFLTSTSIWTLCDTESTVSSLAAWRNTVVTCDFILHLWRKSNSSFVFFAGRSQH